MRRLVVFVRAIDRRVKDRRAVKAQRSGIEAERREKERRRG